MDGSVNDASAVYRSSVKTVSIEPTTYTQTTRLSVYTTCLLSGKRPRHVCLKPVSHRAYGVYGQTRTVSATVSTVA